MTRVFSVNEMGWQSHPNPNCKGAFVKKLIDAEIDENLKSFIVKLEPGGIIPLHTHTTLELFYIIEGEGILTANDKDQKVTPGYAIHPPAGNVHGMRNESSEPLIFIANYAPAE